MVLNSPTGSLRVAVIGAGVMGQHHLRICSLLKGIDIVGVLDIHEERAKEVGLKFSCQAYTCLEDVVGKVDAVIIAVPTQAHAAVGRFFLQNGIHCLIEKPLALTEQDCLSLMTLAEQKSLVLAVGHTEHYNAGVQALRKLIDKENHTILSIDASRLNYGSSRISDVDVVLDLMIHDLEIVGSLIHHPALTITACTIKQANQNDLNYVFANMTFSNGSMANLTASRLTPACVRTCQVTTDKAYFTLDYQTQTLVKFEMLSDFTNNIVSERISVRMQDSLISEISAFRDSIVLGEKQCVDGQQALSCLRLAWKIQEQAKSSRGVASPEAALKKAVLTQ